MTGEAAITELLNAANSGDLAAQDAVYTTLYDELKRCAQRMKIAPGSSMTSTALVHELFLRLNQRHVVIHNRAHFFALAARAMRQIIVDHARRHYSLKRGGDAQFTDAEKGLNISAESAEQALELDAALTQLAGRNRDLAQVVEWHFFAGLSFSEIGVALGRHERTVQHDWALARALLQESMRAAPSV